MKQLFMAVGISGSGKSTYLKKHFRPEVVINPDSIRKELAGGVSNHTMEPVVWATTYKRIRDSLMKNGEAVLDATNVVSKYRTAVLKNYKDIADLETIAIVFPTDAELSKSRIKKDLDGKVDRSDVPDDVVDRQLQNMKAGYQNIAQQFDKVIIVEQKMLLTNLLLEIKHGQAKNLLKK